MTFREVIAAAGRWMLAVALAAMLAAPAQAQFGEAAGIAEAMHPDYLRRDMVLFEQGLHLDDTQRTIVDALHGDYEQSFEQGLANMRKRLEDMREELQSQDADRVLRIVFRPIEDWSTEKRRLGEVFLENVKVVLTREQQETWPQFERFLFREKNLSRGRFSGESVNLFHIVRDMNLNIPEMQAVQPVLDEYDVALDASLRARQDSVTSNQAEMLKSFAEQNSAVSLAILQRQIDFSAAVRRVNDEFIEHLAEVMPRERQQEFRHKALERGYPRVYRATPVQNIFKVARELEDLDPSVLGAVLSLEAAYLADLATINQQLVEGVRNWEPRESRLRAEAFANRMAGAQPAQIEDPMREVFVRRDEIARDYCRQLQALLTAEQFGQLPGGYRWADSGADSKVPNRAMPTGEPVRPMKGFTPEQPREPRPDEGQKPG